MRTVLVTALAAGALVSSAHIARAQSGAPRALAPLPSILVGADWLAAHRADPGVVVLHVAPAERDSSYAAGHVPGARLLDFARVATQVNDLATELPPEADVRAALEELGVGDGSRVVLVGEPIMAARAWVTLDWLGAGDRAAVLDGGTAAWRAGGHPVSRERPAPAERGRLTTRVRPDMVVDAAWVRARYADPRYALVDARPDAEYTGQDTRNGRFLPGHIPGARQLFWQRLLVSTADPRLRPADELRQLFESAGASADRTVVNYCMVGQRASVTYFVSRLLGYDAKFYDGSWDDWSRRKLPYVSGNSPGTAAQAITPQ